MMIIPNSLNRDLYRSRLLEFTRRAYSMIDPVENPKILDIGCGSGVPTLELAGISGGTVTAVDPDREALERLRAGAARRGLGDKITIVENSIQDMDFPDETFDIIWCEGAVFPVGFTAALSGWKRFLKNGGYMVIHDEAGDEKKKKGMIQQAGYSLIGHFTIVEEEWRKRYFHPLQVAIEKAEKESPDRGTREVMDIIVDEISRFKSSPERSRSAFFIMKKGIE